MRSTVRAMLQDAHDGVMTHRPDGTIRSMTEITELNDDDLERYAREWRQRSLRGDKEARGIAHALETELRKRGQASAPASFELDTRPAPLRRPARPWWRLW